MQIFVRDSATTLCVDAECLADLKSTLQSRVNFSQEVQYLTFAGRVLDLADDQSLSSVGLTDLCTVEICSRLIGGKVHGSLARAGKVKGQTPKVDKKEKKKKQTGRAKRRLQYTRRFVNVVASGPRKRGPNSNS